MEDNYDGGKQPDLAVNGRGEVEGKEYKIGDIKRSQDKDDDEKMAIDADEEENISAVTAEKTEDERNRKDFFSQNKSKDEATPGKKVKIREKEI